MFNDNLFVTIQLKTFSNSVFILFDTFCSLIWVAVESEKEHRELTKVVSSAYRIDSNFEDAVCMSFV